MYFDAYVGSALWLVGYLLSVQNCSVYTSNILDLSMLMQHWAFSDVRVGRILTKVSDSSAEHGDYFV